MAQVGPSSGAAFCKDHPNAPLVEDARAGDQICSECGLVIGDRVIDVGSEWRTFSGDKSAGGQDPSRVGAAENPLLNGADLTTMIGGGKGSVAFDELGNAKYQNKASVSASNRALISGFKEISQMAESLNMPKCVADRASNLFKNYHENKNLKGRSNDSAAAACLYIACRQEGQPRTFKELCGVSKISKKEIGRAYKLILKALDISVAATGTGDFVTRYCSNLGLSQEVERCATLIARKAVDKDMVSGLSPITVAAAAIYMASQASPVKRTLKEIGAVTGIADVTIRQTYKPLYERAEELFPMDFKFDTPLDLLPLP